MSRSKLLGALFALPLLIVGAGSAQANIIGLTIDASGSIGLSDFNLQKNGYVAALTSLLNIDGSNAIGVWKFGDSVTPVFAVTLIDSQAKKDALITAIGNMTYPSNQNTNITQSILDATTAITAFAGAGNCNKSKCLIDVSTDGVNNIGANPSTATATANAAGVKVNCLHVGNQGSCDFNGTGLDFTATSFSAFTAAITAKLTVELTKTPEPITMSLFGTGLLGAAALRRRKNKTA